jgi:hypothetical protein
MAQKWGQRGKGKWRRNGGTDAKGAQTEMGQNECIEHRDEKGKMLDEGPRQFFGSLSIFTSRGAFILGEDIFFFFFFF